MSLPRNSSDKNRGRKRPREPQQEGAASSSSSSSAGSPRTPAAPQFEQGGNGPDRNNKNNNNNNGDDDPYGEDDDIFDAANLPNDTMATVLALQKEFYGAGRNSAFAGERGGGERTGVVLQHQLYTVLENRTAVDLELTAMRKENILRTFRLGTGREDWGIMSTEHYLRVISNLMGDATSRSRDKCSQEPARPASAAEPTTGNAKITRGSSSSSTSGGRKPAINGSCSSSAAAAAGRCTKSAPREQHASFARDVLERLVLSNTNAYASRKQVSTAMREVLQEQDRKQDVADAADGKSSTGCRGGDGGGGAAAASGGRRIAGDGFNRLASLGRAKGQPRIVKGGGEGDEQDLGSLKRDEGKVLSLTSKLVQAGFLLPRRDVGREEAYWFSMPHVGFEVLPEGGIGDEWPIVGKALVVSGFELGKAIAAISRGRKDIVGALKRTRYKEMRRSDMETKNPAKTTGLPLSFHVRDLLGLGMIRELDTPSGMFLRLPTNTS